LALVEVLGLRALGLVLGVSAGNVAYDRYARRVVLLLLLVLRLVLLVLVLILVLVLLVVARRLQHGIHVIQAPALGVRIVRQRAVRISQVQSATLALSALSALVGTLPLQAALRSHFRSK